MEAKPRASLVLDSDQLLGCNAAAEAPGLESQHGACMSIVAYIPTFRHECRLYVSALTYICMYTHVCVYGICNMYIYICVYIYLSMCVYTQMHIHIYENIAYLYAYIYRHTHVSIVHNYRHNTMYMIYTHALVLDR